MSSSLIVEVCSIKKIKKHPHGDFLEIAEVKGWDCIVKKNQFKKDDVVVFIPPDSIMPTEMADRLGVRDYLGGSNHNRVRCARLRGVVSYGLVIENEENWEVGTDVADHYQIEKYFPPIRTSCGDADKEDVYFEKYTDIENIRNYPDTFEEGEIVVVTEKVDGTSSRLGRDINIVPDRNFFKNLWKKLTLSKKERQWKVGSSDLKRKRPSKKKMCNNTYWYPYNLPGIHDLINHLIDDKGYIYNPPNESLTFLNPRDIYMGIKLSYNF